MYTVSVCARYTVYRQIFLGSVTSQQQILPYIFKNYALFLKTLVFFPIKLHIRIKLGYEQYFNFEIVCDVLKP